MHIPDFNGSKHRADQFERFCQLVTFIALMAGATAALWIGR